MQSILNTVFQNGFMYVNAAKLFTILTTYELDKKV